jgi:hypothetical protein
MHDEKIDVGGDGALKRDDARIDSGADLGNAPAVRDLKAVEGIGSVFESGAAGAPVAVGDEIGKLGHGIMRNVKSAGGAIDYVGRRATSFYEHDRRLRCACGKGGHRKTSPAKPVQGG